MQYKGHAFNQDKLPGTTSLHKSYLNTSVDCPDQFGVSSEVSVLVPLLLARVVDRI